MEHLLTGPQFIGLAVLFLAMITGISMYGSAAVQTTKASYYLNNRATSTLMGAVASFAAWTWAPAYFISSMFGYQYGWIGPFWYTPINALCLALFAFAAYRITSLYPLGITLPEYMGRRYSKRVESLYLLALGALGVSAFAVQVLAGAEVVAYLTPIPKLYAAIGIAFAPMIYTAFGGMRASILSDNAKGWMLITMLAIVLPWVFVKAGGWENLAAGLYGKNADYVNPFVGEKAYILMLTFGIPASLNWLAGPWRDQSFWQLAYAGERKARRNQFLLAAPIFAVVVLALSLLGIIAAGAIHTISGFVITNPQYVGIELVQQLLPWPVAVAFTMCLVLGLISTLDSHVVSVATLFGSDIFRRFRPHDSEAHQIRAGRIAMFAVPVIGVLIAVIPGLKIIHLFLIYGSLGAATFLPTVITLFARRTTTISESGMFWGIVISLTVGWPMAVVGYFLANPTEWMAPITMALSQSFGAVTLGQMALYLPIVGAVTTMAASGVIVLISTALTRQRVKSAMVV